MSNQVRFVNICRPIDAMIVSIFTASLAEKFAGPLAWCSVMTDIAGLRIIKLFDVHR